MPRRAGLIHLMALIAVIALGLGAMKVASDWLARVVALGSCLALMVASLGAIVRPRLWASWAGFAVFGWGYALIAVGQPIASVMFKENYPSEIFRVDRLAVEVADRLHPIPASPPDPSYSFSTIHNNPPGTHFHRINGKDVPFDAVELKARLAYEDQVAAHEAAFESVGRSISIGMVLQGIIFALIGGLAGRLLAHPAKAGDARVGGTS